jgi:hypothetical protein
MELNTLGSCLFQPHDACLQQMYLAIILPQEAWQFYLQMRYKIKLLIMFDEYICSAFSYR